MLGSYESKANEIIQSLPTTRKAIFQQMDRHFNLVTIKKSRPWVSIHAPLPNSDEIRPRMEWLNDYKQQKYVRQTNLVFYELIK